MNRQFRDEQRDTPGWSEHAVLWVHALWDVAISTPRDLAHELEQDLHFTRALLSLYRRSVSGCQGTIP